MNDRHRPLPPPHLAGWRAGALLFAAFLRVPWLDAPLGNDEGGLTYIAGEAHGGGPFLYGEYFIDRPPLLLAVFRLAAETGGTATVRTIGVAAALMVVATTTLLAREMAGEREACLAAALTAILVSSPALGSVLTPAELVAVLPSALSVLLVWRGTRGGGPRPGLVFTAGLLAVCALLVKQSFGDALLAGLTCMIASWLWRGLDCRHAVLALSAYACGVTAAIVGVEVWERVAAVPDGSMSYALLGFRLDGLAALAGSANGLPGRFAGHLLLPLVLSGFAVVLLWAIAGLRVKRGDRALVATLGAWGIGGALGVLGGGSYWGHYLIQLVPFAAVGASIALARASPRRLRATGAILVICAAGGLVIGPLVARDETRFAAAIGNALGESAHSGDTAHVLYAQPDVLYYSGLRDPFPYNWSLMMRAMPGTQPRLRALLASRRRPTWIVLWEPPRSYDLDSDGATTRLLSRYYRRLSEACGVPVLVRRGAARRFRPPSAKVCESTPS